jgi:hypothetical protein
MGGAMTQAETTQTPTIDQLQKLHRRRMALFGLVILVAGIAIGAASTVILIPHDKTISGPGDPEWASLMMVGRLGDVLDLTPQQLEETRLISKTAFEVLGEIQAKAKPEIDEVVKDMNIKILEILTPEQREKWQRELDDFNRRFSEGWRRGGRGPGSGRRRGPGDPNRSRRGPGKHPDDPNRPWNGPRQGPNDPNRPRDGFRRGTGSFGPSFGPDDPNRPRGGFDREAMRDRDRREGGSFGRRPRPDDPNRPPLDMNSDQAAEPNRIQE